MDYKYKPFDVCIAHTNVDSISNHAISNTFMVGLYGKSVIPVRDDSNEVKFLFKDRTSAAHYVLTNKVKKYNINQSIIDAKAVPVCRMTSNMRYYSGWVGANKDTQRADIAAILQVVYPGISVYADKSGIVYAISEDTSSDIFNDSEETIRRLVYLDQYLDLPNNHADVTIQCFDDAIEYHSIVTLNKSVPKSKHPDSTRWWDSILKTTWQ